MTRVPKHPHMRPASIQTPSLPHSATSTHRPRLARPLSPARARPPPGEPLAPSRSSTATSHHAGPHDRTMPESHHRLAWSLRCVRARSPPALPEPHLDRAPPEVRIAGHLRFSLSLFLLRLCAFTSEGPLRYYIVVLCPSSQPPTPDALPSLRCRWPRSTERTLFAAREDEDPDTRGPLAVSPMPTSFSPSLGH